MQSSIRLRPGPVGPLVLCVLISACAGNGEGLDGNGRPIDEGPLPGDDERDGLLDFDGQQRPRKSTSSATNVGVILGITNPHDPTQSLT
jgi:hypothetical protein